MRGLGQLQRDFQQYLLQQAPVIQTAIASTESVSANVRLDIYRHAYYARLLEVLQLDYPAVHTLLGDDEFRILGRRYIDANPSRFRSIRWFGDSLAAFMEKTAPYADKSVLIEMARFEWLLTETFDAIDNTVMSLESMAEIPFEQWPEMRFAIHPTVKRVDFRWNVIELWRQANESKPLVPKLHETAIPYLIWRKDFAVQFCSLSPDAAYMIDAMLTDTHFGDICEGLCAWLLPEQVAMHAASLLKRYVIDGLIHRVVF